jgi:hypothetical protein
MFFTRLSDHFILLDFLYDRDNYSKPTPLKGNFLSSESVGYGALLCQNLLEPMMEQFGPCSIAAGVVLHGNDQHASGPHGWYRARGAAADVAFHNWVNPTEAHPHGMDPASMIPQMTQMMDIPYTRLITYAGSEFMCLAYHPNQLSRSTHINRRQKDGVGKPYYRSLKPSELATVRANPHWRRLPGEPIYHTRKHLRAQHVRVGRFFTMLDFCRSVTALEHGLSSVPPVFSIPHITTCHQAAKLLDPLVDAIGRLSITSGIEGLHARKLSGEAGTEWRQQPNERPMVRWAFPARISRQDAVDAEAIIRDATSGITFDYRVDHNSRTGMVFGEITWTPFPVDIWTSAHVPFGSDQNTIRAVLDADSHHSKKKTLS